MAENIVNVTEGSGKKLHTWDTTIGANLVQDEFVVPGEYPYPTYVAAFNNVSIAGTTPSVQIMAGASLKVRIRRIHLEQRTNATTAGITAVQFQRLTSAGTGGGVITPRPYDTADAASGATCMTLPTVLGTVSLVLFTTVLSMRQALPASGTVPDDVYEWVAPPNGKSIVIPVGATQGLNIQFGVVAGATVDGYIEFVETAF